MTFGLAAAALATLVGAGIASADEPADPTTPDGGGTTGAFMWGGCVCQGPVPVPDPVLPSVVATVPDFLVWH
ncbi:hypothetical protein [Alloactinosynnema sp. L-07]|nr:hypothetical protein [Alloactinosynnema sp. L-07]